MTDDNEPLDLEFLQVLINSNTRTGTGVGSRLQRVSASTAVTSASTAALRASGLQALTSVATAGLASGLGRGLTPYTWQAPTPGMAGPRYGGQQSVGASAQAMQQYAQPPIIQPSPAPGTQDPPRMPPPQGPLGEGECDDEYQMVVAM